MNVLVVSTISAPMCVSSLPNLNHSDFFSNFPGKSQVLSLSPNHGHKPFLLSHSTANNSFRNPHSRNASHLATRASSSVGSTEYKEESATNVKFQKSLTLPGCSVPLSLVGTGFREKTFAIIGVKVYAAGLYINKAVLSELSSETLNDSSLSSTIFKVPMEKSLQIVLVRDVDGKTFWDALDEAVSPRIKARLAEDEAALSTFREIFQGRPLKKGTFIFLTWLDPSKMLVCVSSEGLPSSVDATIVSRNVTSALFDVFFGENPVSPSLKSSVMDELTSLLK